MSRTVSQESSLAQPTKGRSPIPAALTLAGQQVRQTWRLLLAMGLGLALAIALVGAVPLFSQVAITSGLQQYLMRDPSQLNVTVKGTNLTDINQLDSTVLQKTPALVGTYLQSGPFALIEPPGASLLKRGNSGQMVPTRLGITLNGYDPAQLYAHLTLIAGRFPDPTQHGFEVVMERNTAAYLNIPLPSKAGGAFTPYPLYMTYQEDSGQRVIPFQVVGVIANPTFPEKLWRDHPMLLFVPDKGPPNLNALVPQAMLLRINQSLFPPKLASSAFMQYAFNWVYTLNPAAFTSVNLDQAIGQFDAYQATLGNDLAGEQVSTLSIRSSFIDPDSLLSDYQSRIINAQIPVIFIFLGILGSAILFTGLLADLLIERQTGVIAVLRSRGFSRGQLYGAIATQSLGLCVLALLLGAALTLPLVHLLVGWQLPASLPALGTITRDAGQTLHSVLGYMLLAVACALLAILLATGAAMQLNVLTLRREAARTTQRPLWQRLHLDVVALVVAVLGLGIAVYLQALRRNIAHSHHPYVLGLGIAVYLQASVIGTDPQTDRLLAPVSFIAPIFALLALSLVYFRGSQVLLRLGNWYTRRQRGALAMLAMTQLERSPRQLIRLSLFLSLALAYTIFALTFAASQSQRAQDVAAQQVGADFTGQLINPIQTLREFTGVAAQLPADIASFQAIPGVKTATLGHITTMFSPVASVSGTFNVIVVDSQTYGQTATWPSQDTSIPLSAMMTKLRAPLSDPSLVPAIVDATTQNIFHLSMGQTFTLNGSGNTFSFIAVKFTVEGVVPTLPQTPLDTGGVLADVSQFARSVASSEPTPLDQVWLRTDDSAQALASVRTAINSSGPLQMDQPSDRRALLLSLQQEPLTVTLLALLLVGVGTPILLALIGTIMATWQQVRQELTGMALLRALGASPGQLTRMILWEQGLAFGLTLVLGTGVGFLFAWLTLPNLIFTNVTSSANITQATATSIINGSVNTVYRSQRIPPVEIVFPPTILFAIGALVVIGALALGTMVLVAARASLSQTLRLNED